MTRQRVRADKNLDVSAADVSQAELAAITGISKSVISRMVQRRQVPSNTDGSIPLAPAVRACVEHFKAMAKVVQDDAIASLKRDELRVRTANQLGKFESTYGYMVDIRTAADCIKALKSIFTQHVRAYEDKLPPRLQGLQAREMVAVFRDEEKQLYERLQLRIREWADKYREALANNTVQAPEGLENTYPDVARTAAQNEGDSDEQSTEAANS